MQDFVLSLQAKLDQGEEAAAQALVAAEQPTGSAKYPLGLAVLALARRAPPDVLRHAQAAQALAPDDPLPHHYLMLGAAAAGDLTSAVTHGQAALSRGGGSPIALAQICLSAARIPEAEALFRQALQKTPRDVPALQGLAMCLLAQDNARGAIRELARAHMAQPGDASSLTQIVDVLAQIGKLFGAIAAARTLLDENPPADVAALLHLSILRFTTELAAQLPQRKAKTEAELADAAKALLHASESQPRPFRFQVVRALIDAERYAQVRAAISDLTEDTHKSVERAELLVLQSYLADHDGMPEQALTLLRTALRFDSSRSDAAAIAVGLVLDPLQARLSEAEAAVAIEELLALLDPAARLRDPRLLVQLARHAERTGRRPEALHHVQQATALAAAAQDQRMQTLCIHLLKTLSESR